MRKEEIQSEYEWNTGQVIIDRLRDLDPLATPAVLVSGHAPFCWGRTVTDATHTAAIVEEIAHMAYLTLTINAEASTISQALHDKHFLRKHGPGAYYGQKASA
jgi:L-ribulose-5-phosphate 4-epimerase